MSERRLSDEEALDKLNVMLSEPDWFVGMLEDACELVRATGREEVPNPSPAWPRH